MTKNIFILGNGFDLDLGLQTKYSDFAHSDYWPQHEGPYIPNLQIFLERKRDTESWFDIENELLNYAKAENMGNLSALQLASYNARKDMAYFQKLQAALCKYIQEQQSRELDKTSSASQVLRAVVQNGYFDSIYSFNYTNLSTIAMKLGIKLPNAYTHIHGKVDDNSIILGVDETLC